MLCRVLIVDDSSLVRTHVRKSFESSPEWQVCGEAGNGKEAVEKAQQVHPDCIILDLSMPVMNGIEAARILKKLMPEVPLIMFTSFVTYRLEQEAFAAGVWRVIGKGDSASELVSVARYLAEHAHDPKPSRTRT
ncbi:MAG TPA: response regulator transcription factor [Verrucomicrobiae bacterium]|jgi:DNA-binding NarL/FixJ family response regulator|nr:response regulator transcription factor [Verrucomicrobiae bacterium]